MTLADRALAAAAVHEPHQDPVFDRAHQRARHLHALLTPSIPHEPDHTPEQVITERDWHRLEPGVASPGLLLTYTDNGASYSFIPYQTDADFLLLDPCPACGGVVPRAAIFELRDFGHYLNHAHLVEPPEPFYGDPGHRAGCPHG